MKLSAFEVAVRGGMRVQPETLRRAVIFLDIDGVLQRPPHYRAGEVKEYLESHPEIERLVIIDDRYREEFDELLPEQFVHTA